MQHRSPIGVFLLTIVTLGIYGIVWSVKTKNELNKLGADIPTAWLIIIPLVNLYWAWKYCEGVEKVTNGKISAIIGFILFYFLGVIAMIIFQSEFNKLSAAPAGGSPAPAPPTPPAAPPTPPTAVV